MDVMQSEVTTMKRPLSEKAFEEAQRVMPGGVNSPVRAFRSVGGNPIFIQKIGLLT